MKNILQILILFLIVGCKSKVNEAAQDKNLDDKNSSKKQVSTSNLITNNQLKETVAYLASDALQGRRTGSQGIEASAVYIQKKLQSFGIKPYFKTYRDTFKIDSINAFNVVGFIEGNDPKLKNEVIVLGAHYDHIGQGQSIKRFGGKLTDVDSIANGANDDASGVAAVLALADHFSKKKTNKRSIVFALFSGEEFGLLGSKHLAKRLKSENVNLYTMIEFEMIGVPLKDRDYKAFLTGYKLSNMAVKLNEYSNQSNLLGVSEFAEKYQLFKRSDNYAFYNEFEVPCQTISTFDFTNYDYYHHVDDEADKMDYDFMAKLVNSIIPAIEKMSATPTKEIKMYE